ncbi:acetate--CoA ligase [Desulfotomaculum copahuensis]|uniref:acetate--CoA ligase n=1 Tax=Desulfotomaculum copahuensis TaxID=1838280 RepID=UPI001FA7F70D|nr:acetate--CoA ligase [Desulfotomaculum copahuensis]
MKTNHAQGKSLNERQTFQPSPETCSGAGVNDKAIYREAAADRETFWAGQAGQLDWFKPWEQVLDESNAPFYRWFAGGKLNAAYNCLDRHLKTERKTKAALIFEGEPGDQRVLTYQELYREVTKCANVLKSMGVRRGDRVAVYLPMIPELPVVMLACARIGAPHSVVFSGFGPGSLCDRINDCRAKLVVTADGGWRRGRITPLKDNCDEALAGCPSVEKVLLVRRTGKEVNFTAGRDYWYHDLMDGAPAACPCEQMDAGDDLFILYTSGPAGKPKGIVHSTGGYLTGVAATHRMVFDLRDDDVFWCTADIGWITGHSYAVYGPLANGCTSVLYEGGPDWPQPDRFWALIEKYGVNILYTVPTAIRSFMKWGTAWLENYDLSSLRLLGSVGEPINPETWLWYHQHVGGGRCPVVDTWWQTETGMILIAPLPGVTPLKPGSVTVPVPGVEAAVVDNAGNPVPPCGGGYLVLKTPWPAMLSTIYGDPDRYVAQYWSRFENAYFTGDGARWDEDGYFQVMGRVDDIINVGGHRLSTVEIESALAEHRTVAEAAVIGKSHKLKGQAVSAFVTLKEGFTGSPELAAELKTHVTRKIGALARPEDIFFTPEMPRTRSGKIMRRLLWEMAEGRVEADLDGPVAAARHGI